MKINFRDTIGGQERPWWGNRVYDLRRYHIPCGTACHPTKRGGIIVTMRLSRACLQSATFLQTSSPTSPVGVYSLETSRHALTVLSTSQAGSYSLNWLCCRVFPAVYRKGDTVYPRDFIFVCFTTAVVTLFLTAVTPNLPFVARRERLQVAPRRAALN